MTDNYMLRPKERLYIACMDLNFAWTKADIEVVCDMWGRNYHPRAIAKRVNRDIDEVAVLLISLGREGRIQKRPSGVFGGISA